MTITKLTIIGGGSLLWTPVNAGRMACSPGTRDAELVIYDLNQQRAAATAELTNAMLRRAYPDAKLRVTAAPTLAAALAGAQVVITCYCVGGNGTEHKLEKLANQYGCKQAVFTAGPGACLNIAIQGRALVEIVRQMQQSCPAAYLINCTNPVPGLVMTAVKAGHDPRRTLGFCGALHWYRRLLQQFLPGADPAALDFRIGGTNHCTFFTEIYRAGADAYAEARATALRNGVYDLGEWGTSTMEINLLKETGYLAMPGHSTDIYPGIAGTHELKPVSGAKRISEYDPNFGDVLAAYGRGEPVDWEPPRESEVPILWLDALTGAAPPTTHSVNLTNLNAVPNLPDWCVPDLECLMDRRGVTPLANPPYPPQIAEVVRRHQVTFELAARAALEQRTDLLIQSIQACPFADYTTTARAMVDEARALFPTALP